MPKLLQVWPKPGSLVIDPNSGRAISPGETVSVTSYLARRILDGDLLTEEPRKETPTKSPKSSNRSSSSRPAPSAE